jgi:predicted lipoprotein with Yx(FWY)xxD motif
LSRKRYLILIAPVGLNLMVACDAAQPKASAPEITPTPTSARAADPSRTVATVDIGMTSIGTVLTDAQGHTLYYLSTEAGGQDACTTQPGCSLMWPALAPPSAGTPVPGIGVNGTLGVIMATDGSAETTYNGWPLHILSGENAGHVTGEGLESYGGRWAVATPDLASTSSMGGEGSEPGLVSPPASTPPGALPTNPFAPTTPPGVPGQPSLPTIPSAPPSDAF